MNFKTQQATDAYKEMVEATSKVAAELYAQCEHLEISATELMSVHLALENFRQEGLSKAILTASTVEVGLLGLQGGLALASLNSKE